MARGRTGIVWIENLKQVWMHLCNEQDGVTSIEYGLLAALIAVACIAAFAGMGSSLEAVYTAWSAAVVAAL